MKELLKKWWLWVIVVLIISLIIFMIFIINKSEGVGTAGISKEEFDEIELGIGQFAVNRIIDKLEEWNDNEIYKKCCEEVEKSKGNHIYRYVYKYYGEKGGYALITYEADYSNGSLFELPVVVKKEMINLQ